jgi:soluble lytic murein transglycosylase-like protein
VWGVPLDDLKGQLARDAWGALAEVDFSTRDPNEALALGPEAPYYLSLIFTSLGRPAPAERMLQVAWDRSPSPWKEEAGVLLAQERNEQKQYPAAIDLSRRILAAKVSDGLQQKARRELVEALYWTKDDAAVLKEAALLSDPDPEVLLFRAVSSLRLGLLEGHDLLLRLFTTERVSALHARAYTFLGAEPAYLALFSAPEQDLLAAKNALVQGDWTKGIPQMEAVLEGIDPAQVPNGALVLDIGAAYGFAGRQAAGAKFLAHAAGRLTGQARVDALEQAGRLYRRVKDLPRALALLRAAAAEAPTTAQADRARWMALDVLITANPPDLAKRVGEQAVTWSDPGWFSDRLEIWIADLVAARRWSALADLWAALEPSGPDDIRAQLSYLLARARQEGDLARLPGQPRVTARELFEEAARRDPDGYYGMLAASIIGRLPDRSTAAEATPASDTPPTPPSLDPFVMGFIPYGLSEMAYTRLAAAKDTLDDEQLLAAARRFAQAGDTRSSMYLVGFLSRRRPLTAEELRMYYPKPYADIIGPLVAQARIPEHFLYALVREESYFDADIVSAAGAVGLTQLMPPTAAAVARGLEMTNPDLRDPGTNLAIGVRHLQDLLSTVDSPTKALLSYNAGRKRLRQWEKASRGLPTDLFVEAVPIAETREYVRKILVSAVMYATLYADADPRETALSLLDIPKRALLDADH